MRDYREYSAMGTKRILNLRQHGAQASVTIHRPVTIKLAVAV